MKKIFIYIFLFLILSQSCSQSSLAIEKDCEVLKKYMQEVSIDCNMAIDEGLDLDDVIRKIKDDYDSVRFKICSNDKYKKLER